MGLHNEDVFPFILDDIRKVHGLPPEEANLQTVVVSRQSVAVGMREEGASC